MQASKTISPPLHNQAIEPNDTVITRQAWVFYTAVALLAVMLPLVLVQLNVPFIRLMDEVYHPIVLLQLFVFSASGALSLVLAGKVWQQRHGSLQSILPFGLGVLVAFHYLAIMRQHATRSWDYRCYEEAAQAIANGTNPYGSCYIYFPTPAQAMAMIERFGLWLATYLGLEKFSSGAATWDLVFYFYEATQLLLVILAFTLCYCLARTVGLQQRYAALLVTALFLFNNPLLATLKHNQVNLWVLDLMLLALLGVKRYPILSGLAVAVGVHIKIYPLALLLPWALKRQWRAGISAGIGLGGIFLVQTSGGRELTLWRHFLAFADSFPLGTFFRDNSLHSLVYNTLGHLKWLLGDGSFPVNELYVSRLVLAGMGFFGLLYLGRFVRRERGEAGIYSNNGNLDLALFGHAMDAIALALIASPVVWEHHYLLALPLVIWGVARAQNERQLWRVGLSAFLIFVVPTFDLYPFSYHRLAGLLLLMTTLSPAAVRQWHLPWRWFRTMTKSMATSQPALEANITIKPANAERVWEQVS